MQSMKIHPASLLLILLLGLSGPFVEASKLDGRSHQQHDDHSHGPIAVEVVEIGRVASEEAYTEQRGARKSQQQLLHNIPLPVGAIPLNSHSPNRGFPRSLTSNQIPSAPPSNGATLIGFKTIPNPNYKPRPAPTRPSRFGSRRPVAVRQHSSRPKPVKSHNDGSRQTFQGRQSGPRQKPQVSPVQHASNTRASSINTFQGRVGQSQHNFKASSAQHSGNSRRTFQGRVSQSAPRQKPVTRRRPSGSRRRTSQTFHKVDLSVRNRSKPQQNKKQNQRLNSQRRNNVNHSNRVVSHTPESVRRNQKPIQRASQQKANISASPPRKAQRPTARPSSSTTRSSPVIKPTKRPQQSRKASSALRRRKPAKNQAILKQSSSNLKLSSRTTKDDKKSWNYSFKTPNGIHQEATGETVGSGNDAQVHMRGSYSYIGDDGKLYAVDWYADDTGYHPTARHIPRSS